MVQNKLQRLLDLRPCSLAIVASGPSATEDQPIIPVAIPVAILDTFPISRDATTTPGFNASWTGVFTSIIGEDVASGASRMDVNFSGPINPAIGVGISLPANSRLSGQTEKEP